MTITIHNTTKIVEFNGIPCRVWEGITEKGVGVYAFIPRVAIKNDSDATQFRADLQEMHPPSAEVKAFPISMTL